jgi:acyl carrier protein
MNTTYERLCTILVQEHHVAADRLAPATLLEDLGIDSLGTVELLWNVEEAFAIKLPTQPPPLRSLDDVVRWIDELSARQGATPKLRAA